MTAIRARPLPERVRIRRAPLGHTTVAPSPIAHTHPLHPSPSPSPCNPRRSRPGDRTPRGLTGLVRPHPRRQTDHPHSARRGSGTIPIRIARSASSRSPARPAPRIRRRRRSHRWSGRPEHVGPVPTIAGIALIDRPGRVPLPRRIRLGRLRISQTHITVPTVRPPLTIKLARNLLAGIRRHTLLRLTPFRPGFEPAEGVSAVLLPSGGRVTLSTQVAVCGFQI